MTPGAEIELGPHWWKASALTTRPTLSLVIFNAFLYIYISCIILLVFIYLNLHSHLYFYIFVLRSYCNVQFKIYIDNCAIEINKIIIIWWFLSVVRRHIVDDKKPMTIMEIFKTLKMTLKNITLIWSFCGSEKTKGQHYDPLKALQL